MKKLLIVQAIEWNQATVKDSSFDLLMPCRCHDHYSSRQHAVTAGLTQLAAVNAGSAAARHRYQRVGINRIQL